MIIKPIRLDRLLANYGICARSATKRFVRENNVNVDGKRITNVAEHFQASDVRIGSSPLEPLLNILMHKPKGYVCSRDREEESKIIYDLLPVCIIERPILSVAGRLDKWVTGLVVMSQDGELVKKIITPKKKPWGKEYIVTAQDPYKGNESELFKAGTLMLRGESTPCKPAGFEILDNSKNISRITLQEGRYHQVRRMLAAVGNKAIAIHRVRIGPLVLGDIKAGEWRKLTDDEIAALKREEMVTHTTPTLDAPQSSVVTAPDLLTTTPPKLDTTAQNFTKIHTSSKHTEIKEKPTITASPSATSNTKTTVHTKETKVRIVTKKIQGKLIITQRQNSQDSTGNQEEDEDDGDGEDENEEDYESGAAEGKDVEGIEMETENQTTFTFPLINNFNATEFEKEEDTYIPMTKELRALILSRFGLPPKPSSKTRKK